MKALTPLLLLTAIGFAEAGTGSKDALPDRPHHRGWKLQSASAGLAWRSMGRLDYRGGSRSQNLMIPSVIGGDSLVIPPIGEEGLAGNRTYNNGFVNIDATGSSDGQTWFWGYDSASQVTGNTLNFNATGSRSAFAQSGQFSGAVKNHTYFESVSPQLDFVFAPPTSDNACFAGVLLSFWSFSDGRNKRFTNFTGTQTRDDFRNDYLDSFDITNIQPVIGAPYVGSATGPGPVLPLLPGNRSSTETLIGGDTAAFSNSISTSFDLDGYSLAIGPTWQGRLSADAKWQWRASAGFTLNLFNWRAREDETLSYSVNGGSSTALQQWRDSDSGNEVRLGMFIKGDLLYQINSNWFATAYLQGEVADSFEIKIGESQYEFEPRGYAFGLSLGYLF